MKFVLVVASSALLASSAFAQNSASTDRTPSSQSGATAGGAESTDEEIVCRRIEANTGTRLGSNRRVCMTRRQWREHERRN